MGGKASILLVLGFSLIFLVVGHNFGNLSVNAVDNLSNYYEETMVHNIAVSAANIAANQVFLNNNWTTGYNNISYQGGHYKVAVSNFGINEKKIQVIATYRGVNKEISFIIKPSSFAKYGYYMNIFPGNMVFFTGDTIDGPFHTQSKLNTMGSPVFLGKATAKLGLRMRNPKDPKFYGGFQSGVDVPFNLDASLLSTAASSGGKVFKDSTGGQAMDLRFTFNADGTGTYSTKLTSSSTWGPDVTESLSTLAPNGVIFNEKGNVYLKGTVNGKYTIGTGLSSGNGHGNVYLEDDVVYRTDPVNDPNCQDLLGIVASNNVVVKNNAANQHDINIMATMFNHKGGIKVEGLNSGSPDMGYMNITGGLIEYQAQLTGYTNGAGYSQKIRYDKRLMLLTPPAFPATQKYEIVSWYE